MTAVEKNSLAETTETLGISIARLTEQGERSSGPVTQKAVDWPPFELC